MEDRPILIKANTTVKVTVALTTASVKLPPGGGRNVMLLNRGTDDVAFNFGDSTITVALPTATAGGAIVGPGMCITCTPPEGATHIATISATAGGFFYVTTGDGG